MDTVVFKKSVFDTIAFLSVLFVCLILLPLFKIQRIAIQLFVATMPIWNLNLVINVPAPNGAGPSAGAVLRRPYW